MTSTIPCSNAIAVASAQKNQGDILGRGFRIAFIALALLLVRNVSIAQLYSEDAAIAQALFAKTKKALVSSYMNIDDTPANATFWRLYDDYEAKRKAIFQERFYLLKEYSVKYMNLDDVTAAKLAEGFMESTAKVDKLNKHTSKNSENWLAAFRLPLFSRLRSTRRQRFKTMLTCRYQSSVSCKR
jgi:hypothetical protein